MLPSSLLYHLYIFWNVSSLTGGVMMRFKRALSLDWIIENRTIPVEVTDVLQQLADQYGYSVDQMYQKKQGIVDELQAMGEGYIVKFLFPDGIEEEERFIHALIRMEIRRLQK
jgi:hypothetical protein